MIYRALILIFPLMLLSGCGSTESTMNSPSVDVSNQEDVMETMTDGPIYENQKFGYKIRIPDDQYVFELSSEQTAIKAEEDSEMVFIVEDQTNFLTIRGITEAIPAHQWLSQNLFFFYPTGEAAQQIQTFAGVDAIVLKGTGASDSPARLMVFPFHEHLMVISYEKESEQFDQILSSFEAL